MVRAWGVTLECVYLQVPYSGQVCRRRQRGYVLSFVNYRRFREGSSTGVDGRSYE